FPRAAAACCAAGVSDGTLPSGGSTTSDVRLVGTTLVPRSNQNSLYAPPRSAAAFVPRRSRLPSCTTFFSNSAASFSVKYSFPANSRGRSKGVIVAFDHIPWRSGWPYGVLGAIHFFGAAGG